MNNTVVIGKVGAPYGVRGWVKIHSFTQPNDNLFGYSLLLRERANVWRAIEVEEFRAHGDGFVARFSGVTDRDAAALITNLEIGVLRDSLPELDDEEFYRADLIGMIVYNHDSIELGVVKDFFETGANDVMVVQDKKIERLIPFVPDLFILDINLSTRRMRVQWDPEF